MAQTTLHLRPTAQLAQRALLPGDPARALEMAQSLLRTPLMFNHHRGLWGYTGEAADGEPLTIQSTGMGGPSAAIVLEELIMLGLRRAIRVGTCGGLAEDLALGELVIASEAIAADGTSRALGAGERASPSPSLLASLRSRAERRHERACRTATIATTDVFYEPDPARNEGWLRAGAVAVEMEAATLFTIGHRHDVQVACVLAVSDLLGAGGERRRIDDETLRGAVHDMGEIATAALSGEQAPADLRP